MASLTLGRVLFLNEARVRQTASFARAVAPMAICVDIPTVCIPFQQSRSEILSHQDLSAQTPRNAGRMAQIVST